MIIERYPATIKLALASMLIAISIAIPLGVIAGTHKNTLTDNLASFVALIGISLPTFVMGPFLVYIFAVKLGVVLSNRKCPPRRHHTAGRHARGRALGNPHANGPLKCYRRTWRGLRPHGACQRA